MRSKEKNIIALIMLMLAVAAYRTAWLESLFGIGNSSAQFILVPVILLVLFLLNWGSYYFPRWPLLLAISLWVGLAFSTFAINPPKANKLRIYFSPFISDPHEAETIKFTTLLEKNLENLNIDVDVERVNSPLNDSKAVDRFLTKRQLEDSNETSLVISGSPRWLSLSLSQRIAEHIVEPSLEKILSAFNFDLVTQVSGTGISNGFSPATLDYIARIIAGLTALNLDNFNLAEKRILEAASIVNQWTSPAHRAYALWLLGNIYLNKAFDEDGFEKAHLLCALEYYNRARSFIRNKNDPEILAAILNNRAITHFLIYSFLGDKKLRKQAIKEFKIAAKLSVPIRETISSPAWSVAKINYYKLTQAKDLQRQFKKKTKKKKK